MILLSHPTANNFVRELLYALQMQKQLHSFHTSIAVFEDDWYSSLLKLPILNDYRRRAFNTTIKPLTHTYPLHETIRLVSQKIPYEHITKKISRYGNVDKVYSYLDTKVASYLDNLNDNKQPSWVYGPEDGVHETFTMAKKKGVLCAYDLPIAYWRVLRELMHEELDRLPSWKGTMGGGITDPIEKVEKKDQELYLADSVIVPSHFVKNSLPTWASNKKIILSPFGTPVHQAAFSPIQLHRNQKLRVLFVGSLTQRKGLADLFEAFKLVEDSNGFELVLLGKPLTDLSFYKNQGVDFTYESGRPNHEVLSLMRTCHVFCLPSIVEGRALVMQEAMSQGLPLIITPNTGGEDLIEEGKTGFLVPIRSPEKIAEKLQWFKDNYDQISVMSSFVMEKAAQITWKTYSDTIIQGLLSS